MTSVWKFHESHIYTLGICRLYTYTKANCRISVSLRVEGNSLIGNLSGAGKRLAQGSRLALYVTLG